MAIHAPITGARRRARAIPGRSGQLPTRTSLIGRIDAYLRDTGMAASRFGRNAINDPALAWDLRGGRQLTPAVESRVIAYLDARSDARPVARAIPSQHSAREGTAPRNRECEDRIARAADAIEKTARDMLIQAAVMRGGAFGAGVACA